MVAEDLGETDAFPLAGPEPAEGWRAFARGIVAELTAAGVELVPARIAFTGDVPRGAGLSSSAALETALCLALLGVAGAEEPDRVELAKLCSRVENDWVGAETGLLDQLASLLGTEGHALRIDFSTLAIEPVPLDLRGWQLVTVDSGAAHEHAESGYNERRAECEAAASELGVSTLSEATRDAAERLPESGAPARPPRADRERARRRHRRRPARGRPRGRRPPARRVPREPARRLRGLRRGGRGDSSSASSAPAPRAPG